MTVLPTGTVDGEEADGDVDADDTGVDDDDAAAATAVALCFLDFFVDPPAVTLTAEDEVEVADEVDEEEAWGFDDFVDDGDEAAFFVIVDFVEATRKSFVNEEKSREEVDEVVEEFQERNRDDGDVR